MIAAVLVFLVGYTISILMITVGYHRGLAHGAVTLHPRVRRFIIHWGKWITGLDPLAWAVMHRRHHAYSDTASDPHSPANVGFFGILSEQMKSYLETVEGLEAKDPLYMKHAEGLDFRVSWANRRGFRWLPYAFHVGCGVILGLVFNPWVGAAWALGILSHPFQGGLVNALGHMMGGRNFDTEDQSTNNLPVAVFIAGEGYQNNHHAWPNSAKFSYRPWEIDWGFGACLMLEGVGLLTIDYTRLIPDVSPSRAPEALPKPKPEAA